MTVPQHIGRYAVRERIGSGGFATVWRGFDAQLADDVAIKVLAAHWNENEGLRGRFIEEARVMRHADSDHIVRVYDIGELADGRPYFVMSYANHGTLAERMAELDTAPALRIATEVARAVGYLHNLGYAHRDIKPSNVLFRSTPVGEQLMIADLGLARAIAEGASTTIVAGTPGYMAPEQAFANAAPDQRTDVYALGALTYHLLTGNTPGAVATGGPVPPSADRSDLTPGVDAVVLRALATDREERWPTASALANALAAIVVPATPPAAVAPHPPPAARATPAGAPANAAPGQQKAPTATALDGGGQPATPADGTQPQPTVADHGEGDGPHAALPERSQPRNRPGPAPATSTPRRRRTLAGLVAGGAALALIISAIVVYVSTRPPKMISISANAITAKIPETWKHDGAVQFRMEWPRVSPFTADRIPVTDETQPVANGLTTQPLRQPARWEPQPRLAKRPGITIIATHVPVHHKTIFDIEHAPRAWPARDCANYEDGYVHRNHAARAEKDLRTWTTGKCASGNWYAHAVVHGDVYDVDVFMTAEPGHHVFAKVARSIRVDESSLQTYIPP